jgi:hypothetical protein
MPNRPSSMIPPSSASGGGSEAKRVSDLPTIPPSSDYGDLRESCSTNMRVARAAPLPRELTDEETHRRATRAFVTPLAAVPVLLVAREDCAWFELGADASALLHAIDDTTTLVALAESCGIAPTRALEIVGQLVREHIVELLPPA